MASVADLENRILVLAPTGRDAANASAILARAHLHGVICRSVEELCWEIGRGAGAVLVTEEAFFRRGSRERLGQCLAQQPQWSDLPFVALTSGGPDSPAGQHAMETLGNVILLERPVRISTCLTAIQTALRMRGRQYAARQHLDDLHTAEQRKDEFLAMLAHELRNPLAPIRNASQLLTAGVRAEKDLRFIAGIIERQMGNLTRLVDDLLDVSRITRGKVVLVRERLDICAAVDGAVEMSRPALEARRHQLSVKKPAHPLFVEGDRTRLTQIVANLLNNAAKFTSDGGRIEVAVEAEGDSHVGIRVSDNGPGIDAALLPRVFDLFVQGENALHRSYGGLGIGLTLVRKLAQLHGGEVSASSEGRGHGASFTVRLPRCASPALERAQRASCLMERVRRRVLVVDDNVDGARTLCYLLAAAGHDAKMAFEGRSALDLARQFQPQFCVLDIGLPGMDGYELASRIRADATLGAPQLIALSGYGEARSRERGREVGFDHYLVKPVEFDRLLAIMNGAAESEAGTNFAAPRAGVAFQEPLRRSARPAA